MVRRMLAAERAAEAGLDPASCLSLARREEKPLDPNTRIEPILKCLSFKDEAKRREAADTLRRLTGQDLGADAEAWNRWWAENRATWRGAKRAEGMSATPVAGVAQEAEG